MQTGISTASLFMRKNNEEALPLLNDLGVKTAEVFLTSFSEYGKEFGELLAKVKGDLTINSVHALNTEFEPQLFSAHPRVKGDAYGWWTKFWKAQMLWARPIIPFTALRALKRRRGRGDTTIFRL